jgi:hypothetical protein
MARRRSAKSLRTPEGTAPDAETPNVEGGENETDTDDDDEEGEDDDADEEADAEPEMLETEKEIQAASDLQVEQHRARVAVREKEVTRQQASGAGAVNYDEVRSLENKAADKVLAKSRMKRGPGVYVMSNIVVANERGERTELPEGARVPDTMVKTLESKRVKGKSELLQLIDDGVLEDLRV